MGNAELMRQWNAEDQARHDAIKHAEAILSRWLAHQYSHQEQFVILREARDKLRFALKE